MRAVVLCVVALSLLLAFTGRTEAVGNRREHVHHLNARVRDAPTPKIPRPNWTDYPKMARYLVHMNSWGTMGTTSIATGHPWTNVVDLSDGPMCNSTGRLFYYLTQMDETARDVTLNPTVAFTVAESSIYALAKHGCGTTDDEDPTCAKMTVVGDLKVVPVGAEADYAIDLLASRHPQIKDWPPNHGFAPYELHIQSLNMLDFYGGMKNVSVSDYFGADLSCAEPQRVLY